MEVQDNNNIRNRIADTYPDAVFWDNLDEAIIGVSTNGRVVYSMERMLEHFQSEGMSEDESIEYIDFNILSTYIDENTPIHMWEDSIEYDE
jgi:hypothetical protein